MSRTPWRERATLRPAEVADVTGLSRSSIDRRIESGDIPSVLIGRNRLVAVRAVLELIGETTTAPVPGLATPGVRTTREAVEFLARFGAKGL